MLWISSLVVSALINARLPRVGGRGERQTFSSQSLVLVCWSPGLWAMGDAVRGEEAKEEIGACVSTSTAWLYLEAGSRPPVQGY